MITRFRIPLPSRRRMSVTAHYLPTASPPVDEVIEVEIAERDESRGTTTLRARVPIADRMVKTPWITLSDDIAVPFDRLRGFLVCQAQQQYDDWLRSWELEDERLLW